ncbi:maleylpyruvate isomerase N-terminal domain-containing protein [Streptomyces sp. UNOB3_S3]|uniref:maleylpyruvate isomerase N-terminal domain-containing protein n=1 Tax=Streptomyces sp. UNOB3_S3 TaxID=2871682 RepID=UPI001E634B67|nr:maleylpyruvate isomerase N-terminal domain-containing protein [Streptomyces sp. UNOB3_S3]MCC3777668.1 maleylpyruvate isomerase N-terminal domain-containing protein [Streptomyces sp. UNOB3_S3]
MGTAGRFDAGAEHERARAALRAAVPRLAGLLRDAADPGAPSGVPQWTVGDVGAHVCAVYVAYSSTFTREFQDWDSVLPEGDVTFAERVGSVNAKALGLIGEEARARLDALVVERGETFLRVTEGLAPDVPVATPWYGPGVTIPLAAATGMMLSETLLHGLDIARGARLPWAIAPDDARLVLGQSMPTMMPFAVDAARARGVRIAFDLAVEGGPQLAVVVEDGVATVTRDAPPRAYDCRVTTDPTTFLLIAFRRMPLWKAVVRGAMRPGGRRPWLAPRLSGFFVNP